MKSEPKEPTLAARIAKQTGNPVVQFEEDGVRYMVVNCNGRKQRPAGERSPYVPSITPVICVDPALDTIQ